MWDDDSKGSTGQPVKEGTCPPGVLGTAWDRAALNRPRLTVDLGSELARVLVRWAIQILRTTRPSGDEI